jgi:hypothetical protein
MKSVTVYLRAPLFVPDNGAVAPKHCMVVQGELLDNAPAGGMLISVTSWADQKGKPLVAPTATLFLPMAKIDHMVSEN